MRAPFFAEVLRADLFDDAFLDVFLEAVFFVVAFFAPFLLADFFFDGTFAPAFLASDKPIAMACFRDVTFFPLPLFSLPRFLSLIVFSTFSPAFFEYLAIRNVLGKREKFRPAVVHVHSHELLVFR